MLNEGLRCKYILPLACTHIRGRSMRGENAGGSSDALSPWVTGSQIRIGDATMTGGKNTHPIHAGEQPKPGFDQRTQCLQEAKQQQPPQYSRFCRR